MICKQKHGNTKFPELIKNCQKKTLLKFFVLLFLTILFTDATICNTQNDHTKTRELLEIVDKPGVQENVVASNVLDLIFS